ncbi:MAG: GNAT family N-acetyltransferase [Anaerolineales bacterium]|nr:GNAT family N-acetyltransferase [Anaerolineales bacterium]
MTIRPIQQSQSRAYVEPHVGEPIMRPASDFTIDELTDIYNQTRTDYIIPMPMTPARLQEYIDVYDVNLSASCVMMEDDGRTMLGLGMLGVRADRAWITRLGVLPTTRKRGLGHIMMDHMIGEARARDMAEVWLEVIKDNEPAYKLFCKKGFVQTRELLVARRPPSALATRPQDFLQLEAVDDFGALDLLRRRRERANWLNEIESFYNVRQLTGLVVTLPHGSWGWAVFEPGALQLRRVLVGVERGDVVGVTTAVLQQLHAMSPMQDAIVENLDEHDPRWPGYEAAGYFETFRRIEMVLQF